MLKKTLVALTVFLSGIVGTSSVFAGGGASAPTLSLTATSATEIFVGDSVTFSYSYGCDYGWSTASLQPFDDSGNRGNAITIPAQLAPTNVNAQTNSFTETGTFSLTFASTGTYNIDARVETALYANSLNGEVSSSGLSSPCNVANAAAKVVVTVRDRPTTTTTTIAPTTTAEEKEVLPATGSDNSSAVIAAGIALAGAAVLISRRRLLTK